MRVLGINDYSAGAGAEFVWRRTHELLTRAGVESRAIAADEIVGRRTPVNYLYSRAFAKAVRSILDEWEPDVVHLHNIYHLCSSSVLHELRRARKRGRRVRVFLTAHDLHLICPSPGALRWHNSHSFELVDPAIPLHAHQKVLNRWDQTSWARSWLRGAQHLLAYDIGRLGKVIDLVLCPSEFLARSLGRQFPTRVLPNPAPQPVPTSKPSHLRVLSASRLVPEKGLLPFVQMAPAWFLDRLTVVGGGPEERELRALAASGGRSTQFTGPLDHESVLHLLEASSVLVLPSRCLENSPTILFEALSRGANFLASNLGGIPEIVRDTGAGFLFDPWDGKSVASAIQRVSEAFENGTLNSFDASSYLQGRSDENYLRRLLGYYELGIRAT